MFAWALTRFTRVFRGFVAIVGISAGYGAPPAAAQWIAPPLTDAFDPWGPPISPYFQLPQSVVVDRQYVAGEPLPPARLNLRHRRTEPLQVEIFDRKSGQVVFRQKLDPQVSAAVTLDRDSGGYVMETIQTVDPWGRVGTRQQTRAVPPTVRYEVIVHQWQIQSIAIDRTGKSPSPIEDVQFQGRGIGRFSLPPGDRLRDGTIDVYRTAVAAGNAGEVLPILPDTENDGPVRDPLREVLQQIQSQSQR